MSGYIRLAVTKTVYAIITVVFMIKKSVGLRIRVALVSTTLLFSVLAIGCLTAISSATSYGGGNIQDYTSKKPLDNGTIVQLIDRDSKTVGPASAETASKMFGVVVDKQQLSVRLSSEGLENQTYVADSGTYSVLVSTQNGEIKAGDYITISSIAGVGMKAGTDEPTVFGRAVGGFDGKSLTIGSTELKNVNGQTSKTVSLGSIPVTIDIKKNPNIKSTKAKVPEMLERVGQAIAEKEVSPIRIYISTGIAVISLISAIIVIYSGVRNSVISIGRNPMSKKSIFRALAEIIMTSVLILLIGLFAVYLLLKL